MTYLAVAGLRVLTSMVIRVYRPDLRLRTHSCQSLREELIIKKEVSNGKVLTI